MAAGAADPENRRVLKRRRELIDACDRTIRDFLAQLGKDAPGLVPDAFERMTGRLDRIQDPPQLGLIIQPDPDLIASMATGRGKPSEAPVA